MSEICKDCEIAKNKTYYSVYQLKCFECRRRLLFSEDCKRIRGMMADELQKTGDVPEWKKEPSCGCKDICKRRQLMRLSKDAH